VEDESGEVIVSIGMKSGRRKQLWASGPIYIIFSLQCGVLGFCEHDDEPSPAKCREFLHRLGNSYAYQDKNWLSSGFTGRCRY